MKRYIYFILLVVLIVYSSCESPTEDEVKYLIGVSQVNLTESWRIKTNDEIRYAAARSPETRIIFTDAADNSVKQCSDIEKLLGYGIDLLIISPLLSESLNTVLLETSEKIPVIIIDQPVPDIPDAVFLGLDNRAIGREAALFVKDRMKGKQAGILELTGTAHSPAVQKRTMGFHEIINEEGNLTLIDSINCEWMRDRAEDILKERISSMPDLNVVFAHNDEMAYGAYLAAKKMRVDNILYIGIDGLSIPEGGLSLLRNGILNCTFIHTTLGDEAMECALKILQRECYEGKTFIFQSKKITDKGI